MPRWMVFDWEFHKEKLKSLKANQPLASIAMSCVTVTNW